MLKKIYILCLLAVFKLSLLLYSHTHSVKNISTIDDIPVKDRTFLEEYCHCVFSGDLGYALIGEKPMSIYYLTRSRTFYDFAKLEMISDCLEGIFQNSEKYLFKCFRLDPIYYEIILINKSALQKKILEEQDFLDEIFKRKVFAKDILEEVTKAEFAQAPFWEYGTGVGVLLGYGKSNSLFFIREVHLACYLKKFPFIAMLPLVPLWKYSRWDPREKVSENYSIYAIKAPPVNPNFKTLEEEWKWIVENDDTKREEIKLPLRYEFPFFFARKCEETDKLRKKYVQAREKLGTLFAGKSALEVLIEEANKK